MTILSGDIKLRASKVMADVPEGGGGPSSEVIVFGQSNTVFDDVDSVARTMGGVSIRQLHMHVDTPDTDRLLGAYAIVAKLPSDPNVSVTLAECETFARRSAISQSVADYLIKGVPWNGFLLGNHVKGQANLQIFQRVGTAVPTIGRTLVLVVNEGLATEAVEWVRVIKVESEVRTFTDTQGDYTAQVVKCDLANGLSQAIPGTDPTRYFTVGAGKAIIRDTTEADAANYYGAAALSTAVALGAVSVKVNSVYSQLVPSSATPVPALDQRPAAQRVLTLATAPRQVEAPVAAHTRRIKISQENRGLSYVFQLTPLPAPGSVVVTWVGLGNRYTAQTDSTGTLTGNGAGVVNTATGSLAITLPSLPDVGSAIVVQWAEHVAFTDRSAQGAQVRAPKYAWTIEATGTASRVAPHGVLIEYTSNNVMRAVTDDGNGNLTGDATGTVDYTSRRVVMFPKYMPDPGAEILSTCDMVPNAAITGETLPMPAAADANGFITFSTTGQPVPGTLKIEWPTVRSAPITTGAVVDTVTAGKDPSATHTAMTELEDDLWASLVCLPVTHTPNWPRVS